MVLGKKKKKQFIKRIEEELELNIEDNNSKYATLFAINSILLGGCVVLKQYELSTLLTLSLCAVTGLVVKNKKKRDFDFVQKLARQELASSGKMNSISGEDFTYLAHKNKELEKYNLQFDDIIQFASKIKINNLNYFKQKISKEEYLKVKRKEEKIIFDKMNSK